MQAVADGLQLEEEVGLRVGVWMCGSRREGWNNVGRRGVLHGKDIGHARSMFGQRERSSSGLWRRAIANDTINAIRCAEQLLMYV